MLQKKMMILVIVFSILLQAATSLAADRCREDQVNPEMELLVQIFNYTIQMFQECLPLVSCPLVFDLVRDVKDDERSSPWRSNLIHVIRDRICGQPSDRKVCCPLREEQVSNQQSENLSRLLVTFQEYLTSLQTIHYSTGGDIFILDSQSLVIRWETPLQISVPHY